MTGVDKIKEKILQDSDTRVQSIIADTKKQAEEIMEKANVRAVQRAEEIHHKATVEATEKLRINNSMLQLEMRKDMLATKQQLIEEAFQKALEELGNMDNSEYEATMQKLILNAVETGEEEVLLSKQDKTRLSAGFKSNINQILAAAGKKGMLKFSEETRDMVGGFILNTKGVEINYSFEALLRMYRDEIEPEVAAILF